MKSKFESLVIYKEAMELGAMSYNLISKWEHFHKNTIGIQLIRSIDSIAANIAEGYGRGTLRDKRKFCYYSRGSAQESQTWFEKAYNRGIINKDQYDIIRSKLILFMKQLNGYISYLSRNI